MPFATVVTKQMAVRHSRLKRPGKTSGHYVVYTEKAKEGFRWS
jgi:hypothetical protein